MLGGLSAAIDRRLEDLIVVCVRRQWPALRLVPARWLRLAVAPITLRLRRSLCRVALIAALPVGMVLALLF